MVKFRKHGLSFEEEVEKINSKDFKVAEELIESLFCDMAKLGSKYDNKIFADFPYAYRERQLDSILLPALSKLCGGLVIAELPTIRECDGGGKTSGRIDYWCVYKNYSFVIEVKHSYNSFDNQEPSYRTVINRWKTMNKQLRSNESDIKKYEESTNGVIRIGLHFITSKSEKEPNKTLIKKFQESIPDTFDYFQNKFSKRAPTQKPDIILCWKIPSSIVMRGKNAYPGLWCIAKRYPAITHKGAKKRNNTKQL